MLARGLIVGLFLISNAFCVVSGENVVSKENDVLELVKRVAWHTDPDPAQYVLFKKLDAEEPRLILDILPLFDMKNPGFYNANLVGMIRVLERKNVQPTALPKIRELLDTTTNDISKRVLHFVVFRYLSEFGDSSDCVRLKSFESSENIFVRTIALQELRKLETRLAAVKTNTIPVPVPAQKVTNVTVNSSNPANPDRVPNVAPSTTIEKTNGQSAGFKRISIVVFVIAAASGVLLIFFKKRKKW